MKTLLLCGVVAMSLSACGDDKNNDPKPDDDKEQTEVTPTDVEKPQVPEGFVDLGLSVYWASCNIGAIFPEEYGDYYAWGETNTKDEYTVENSRWCGVSYSSLKSQGVINSNGNLTINYDAARKLRKGRMPTLEEIKELVNDCTWEWTAVYDVNGYKVTGPNGNSIFLPAAGYRRGSGGYLVGSRGSYWSSTDYDGINVAYSLDFDSGYYNWNFVGKNGGFSVRPVMDK